MPSSSSIHIKRKIPKRKSKRIKIPKRKNPKRKSKRSKIPKRKSKRRKNPKSQNIRNI